MNVTTQLHKEYETLERAGEDRPVQVRTDCWSSFGVSPQQSEQGRFVVAPGGEADTARAAGVCLCKSLTAQSVLRLGFMCFCPGVQSSEIWDDLSLQQVTLCGHFLFLLCRQSQWFPAQLPAHCPACFLI